MYEFNVSILYFPCVFLVCCEDRFPPPQMTAPSWSSRCSAVASRSLRALLQRSRSALALVENPLCNTRKNKKRKTQTNTKKPTWQQLRWRWTSGQTCGIDCPGRDLLAWTGDRDAQAAMGHNCPFLYVKSPAAQFGHKVGTFYSFTQRSSNQSLKNPLVCNSFTISVLPNV